MDDNTAVVAVLSTFFLFGLPVAAFIVFRLLAHRERIEMIRQGMTPSRARPGQFVPPGGPAAPQPVYSDARVLLRKGINLAFIGFALTIGLSFIGFSDGSWHPGPWLLGGLIPLFVGLAQVTSALLTDPALLDAVRMPRPGASAPPPAGDFAQHGTYDRGGPYTYRPDGTQELRPPTSPPERRQ